MFTLDIPKLRYPTFQLGLAVSLGVMVAFMPAPSWLSMTLGLFSLIFGITGFFTLMDWVMHKTAERIRELSTARKSGAVMLAQALKGLTSDQTQAVLAGEKVALLLIPSSEEPILFIRGMSRSIPWEFARDFLELSIDTDPFLYPIYRSSNEAFATDFTNLIIAQGWAEAHKGPYAAKLTKPLAWVARRFWIDITEEREVANEPE